MEDLGYTPEQNKKMHEVMYIMREWFDNSIIIIKDNRKPIYWEHDADQDLIYRLLCDAHHGLCELDDGALEEDGCDDAEIWSDDDTEDEEW